MANLTFSKLKPTAIFSGILATVSAFFGFLVDRFQAMEILHSFYLSVKNSEYFPVVQWVVLFVFFRVSLYIIEKIQHNAKVKKYQIEGLIRLFTVLSYTSRNPFIDEVIESKGNEKNDMPSLNFRHHYKSDSFKLLYEMKKDDEDFKKVEKSVLDFMENNISYEPTGSSK